MRIKLFSAVSSKISENPYVDQQLEFISISRVIPLIFHLCQFKRKVEVDASDIGVRVREAVQLGAGVVVTLHGKYYRLLKIIYA